MPRTLSILSLLCASALGQDWHAVPGRLQTRFAAEVTPERAWPEYPRPTLRRERWQNLNGLWEYAVTERDAAMPTKAEGRILVPFPLESALSGVGKTLGPDQRLWYRRTFSVPAAWRGDEQRVLLHFDAVDFECEVWVDGTAVGGHRGGYDPFSFDISAALAPREAHELVVAVLDPTDAGAQPRGKQVREPKSIWYTASSGLWQTVWLEPVAVAHVDDVRVTADSRSGKVRVELLAPVAAASRRWRAWCPQAGAPAANGADAVPCAQPVVFAVEKPERWGPGHPRLYELVVEIGDVDGGAWRVVDRVQSAFAFRELAVDADAHGTTRLLLNGEPLFQFGPLDQGFWPDGLYTPPSLAAVQADLDAVQSLGANMLRKHVKVEGEAFYEECDRRGILVWQDMPSGDCERDPAQFERELRALIAARARHPSIVMWIVFNEGWGQHDTERYVELVRQLDPTRWVSNATGWTDQHCGDVIDVHSYPGPAMAPVEAKRASVLGEFGGLGLPIAGHTWAPRDQWGYVSFDSQAALTDAYVGRLAALPVLIAQGLSAAVYTQLTDVESECNGWLTYDRAVVKVDQARARAAALALYQPPPVLRVVVPCALQEPAVWRYTEQEPPSGWQAPGFDDATWQQGVAGFGSEGTPGARIGTDWHSGAVWLRRVVEVDPAALRAPQWCVHHDEDVAVWINGVLAFEAKGYTTSYEYQPLSAAARAVLRAGANTLAVSCRQTNGGQFIDLGLVDVAPR